MPSVIDAVPGRVPGFPVLGPGIERFAFVGPLLAAVFSRDERKTAVRLRIGVGNQRQPRDGALGVAIRFALTVAIEHVERHAVEIDEGLASRGVGADRWRSLGQHRERRKADDAAGASDTDGGDDRDPHPFLLVYDRQKTCPGLDFWWTVFGKDHAQTTN